MLTLIYIQNGIYHSRRFRLSDYNHDVYLTLSKAIATLPQKYSYAEIRDRAGNLEYQSVFHEPFADVTCEK